MTYDAQLKQRLEELGVPVEPIIDTSVDREYIAYFYERKGTLFGDDEPVLEHRRWTVVYCAPNSCNRMSMRQNIIQTIFELFGSWPSEDNASDANGQRWLYEFDTAGGIDYGEV